MLKKGLIRATSCITLLSSCQVLGATITEDVSDPDVVVISIEGQILPGDEIKFRNLAMKHEQAIVFLESPGGSIEPAIEIGKAIRLKDFTTVVLGRTTCASACALIWVAGTDRLAFPSSKIGFHASYRELNGRQEEIGVGNAIVGRYLTQLNLPERAVIFATVAKPNEIQWLEMRPDNAAGINFTLIADEEQTQAAPDSRSSAPVVQARANYKFEWDKSPWGVRSSEKGCTLLSYFTSEGGTPNSSALVVHAYGNGDAKVIVLNEKFRSLRVGGDYRIKTLFESKSGAFLDIGYQNAEGIERVDLKGFEFDLPAERILNPLGRYDTVTLYYEDKEVDRYPLEGSSGAVAAVRECLIGLPAE